MPDANCARWESRSLWAAVPLKFLRNWCKPNGELVTKNDLTERVWRGVFVEESALRVHIAAIRKAFGPDRDMLATTVGRGYRLLGTGGSGRWMRPLQSAAPQPLPSTNIPSRDLRSHRPHHRDRAFVGASVGLSRREPGRARRHRQDGAGAAGCQDRRQPGLRPTGCWSNWRRCPIRSWCRSAVASVLGIKLEGEEISPDSIARAIGAQAVAAHSRQLRTCRRCRGAADRDDRQPLSGHHRSRDQPRSAAHRRRTCLSRSAARRAA